jgi:glycosyltransferase involved in cell wall biosynthesis
MGGLGELARNFAGALADEGCATTVLTQVRDDGPTPPDEAPPVVRFRSRVGGRRFGYAPRLRRYARDHDRDFDVVHAFSYHAPVALAVSGAVRTPLFFSPVFHAGGHSVLARAAHLVYRPVAGRVFRRAERVFCLSRAERDEVLRVYPFCAAWTTVVPISVDPARYVGVEPFETTRPVILSACRLDRYKRVDVLVRAMGALGADATLVVLGTGPELEPLRTLAATVHPAGTVRVLGAVADVDVRRWQVTATVVASLSTRESFGLSIAEGIVAGAAVVASDLPVHRETADGLGATPTYVAAAATTGDVAAALRSALAGGRPGRPAAPVRAWTDVARDTIAVYEDALAAPREHR